MTANYIYRIILSVSNGLINDNYNNVRTLHTDLWSGIWQQCIKLQTMHLHMK